MRQVGIGVDEVCRDTVFRSVCDEDYLRWQGSEEHTTDERAKEERTRQGQKSVVVTDRR